MQKAYYLQKFRRLRNGFFSSHRRRDRGVALVITLSLLVLVTFASVAFFSRATSNYRVETTRTNQQVVSSTMPSVEAYLINLFLQELIANSNQIGSNPIIYQPTGAAKIIPEFKGTSAVGNPNFPTLIRQSVPGADLNASGHSTEQPSANGISIQPSAWNAPMLHLGSGFTSGQTPNWIYIQKDSSYSASPNQNTVGRFAYNVYEVSGLLNANAAGYPSSVSDTRELKSSTAGANLNSLGISSSAISNLIQFRTNNFSGNYVELVRFALRSGFLSSTVSVSGSNLTLNRFTTRQDLIRYATRVNSGLAPALPYLTHFSRHSTSPTWSPTTPQGSTIDYTALANTASAPNRFLPNVRVQSSFTRADGTSAKAGEPLLKSRFPLSRLAAIGPNGVNSSAQSLVNGQLTNATPATVQRDFGLRWQNGRWEYVGSTGSTVQNTIKTLAEVASENREPNFFELLKAGILSGSIGHASASKTIAGAFTRTLEDDEDLQIARIAACVIDQFDNDNYPTTINFGGVHVHGVEDIPYLFGILNMERWRHDPWGQYTNDNPPGTTSRNYTISMAIKWSPTFWNPHRSAITPSQQPTSIRARILGGQITSIVHTGLGASGNVTALDQTIPIPLPTSTTITFSSPYTTNNHFRDRNRPADGNFATGSLPSQLPWWNSNPGTGGDSYCGFPILTRNQATIRNVTTTTAQGWFARIDVNQAQIVLEYYDGSAWRIYDTVAGYTNLPITGITTGATENWEYGTCAFWIRSQNNVGNDPQFSGKWDPRTTRWAACRGTSTTSGSPPNNSIIFTLWNVTSGRADSFRYNKPFAFLSTTPNPTYFSRWPNGGTTVQLDVKFADPDGVVRPSDGYLGPNILQNPTNTSFRYPILQRKFLNVAELGYTFRDTPWQSLNFFHDRSADSALLDLFCVDEEAYLSNAISAGKINPNTAPQKVLEALAEGVPRDPEGSGGNINPTVTAQGFLSFRSNTKLTNKAQLVNFISSGQNSDPETLKWRREAPVRAWADVFETRNWNLFADVIVQVGRVPPGSSGFLVEGQQRTWTSVAIDRFTAEILEKSSEVVTSN